MAAPNTLWYFNPTATDGTGSWTAITTGAGGHTVVFTGGSANDGDATGTRDTPTIPGSGTMEYARTFIDNATIIDQVPLAGSNQGGQQGGANRYVFKINVDGATQSIPYLEFWDDDGHDSTDIQTLGAGTEADSFIYGIVTTNANTSYANWPDDDTNAKPLAGSDDSNRLLLDTVALTGATDLYFNLATRVPATASPYTDTPVCTLRFSYS